MINFDKIWQALKSAAQKTHDKWQLFIAGERYAKIRLAIDNVNASFEEFLVKIHYAKLKAYFGGLDGRRKILWAVVSCILVFVFWASFSQIEQVTRAQGQVIASSRTQIIQSFDGGAIEALNVKEGEVVQSGQLLVKFSSERAEAAWRETEAKAASLSAASSRLDAEISGKPLEFDDLAKSYPEFVANETSLYHQRQKAIKDELSVYTQSLRLAEQELNATEPLLKYGDVGLAEVLRLRRQVAELKGQVQNRRNKYMQDAGTDYSKIQSELASTLQVLEQRKILLDHCSIYAPMAGTVKNIRFTTLGAVVRSGENIMELVPEDHDLIVEAHLKPIDIGFVHAGLPATIKIDAFDYSIFGSLKGEVIYTSPDTVKDETRPAQEGSTYIVRVRSDSTRLNGRNGQPLDIIPGMTATVEIITGRKTIMSYLTKPITKTVDESMKER